MIKIFLFIFITAEIFIMIGKAINHLLQLKSERQAENSSVSDKWYGICEKCGNKDGLHRFKGKRYCSRCHAELTAEKKYGEKQNER